MNRRAFAGRARIGDLDLRAACLEPQERLRSQEAEPPDLLAADHALEQKRRRRPGNLAKRRNRCQAVAGQLPVNRDTRRRAQAPDELVIRGAITTHGSSEFRLFSRFNGNECTLAVGAWRNKGVGNRRCRLSGRSIAERSTTL